MGELFELCPERCVFLIFFGFLRRGGIVFDEPGEVLSIVDLFMAGVSSSSLYLFCFAIQAVFIKKIQARDEQCEEK